MYWKNCVNNRINYQPQLVRRISSTNSRVNKFFWCFLQHAIMKLDEIVGHVRKLKTSKSIRLLVVVFSLLHICTHKLTYSCTYIHVLYIDRFFFAVWCLSWFSFLFFLVCLFYAYCCGLSLNPGFWGMRIWDHQSMPQTFKFFKFVMNLNGGCKFIDDLHGGFLKWWYPTTIGFSTKNDHFGVWNGGTAI